MGSSSSTDSTGSADSGSATSFTTGTDAALLNSATLDLLAQTNLPATFSLSLRTDAVGIPGATIADFDNTPSTSVRGELLTFNTSTLLLPDTTYWLALTVTPNSGFGGWFQTGPNETGIWSIGGLNFSFDGGATWGSTSASSANFLSLDATIVPEPSVTALLLSVIPVSALIRKGMSRRYDSRNVVQRG